MVLGHRLRYKPKIHLRFGISFSSNGSVPTAINTLSRKEKRDSFCILLVITFRWEQNWTLLGELKGKTHSLFQGQELWLQVPLQTTCFICLVFSHHICWMKNDSNSMQSSLDRFYGILFLLNMNLCCNYMRRKEKKNQAELLHNTRTTWSSITYSTFIFPEKRPDSLQLFAQTHKFRVSPELTAFQIILLEFNALISKWSESSQGSKRKLDTKQVRGHHRKEALGAKTQSNQRADPNRKRITRKVLNLERQYYKWGLWAWNQKKQGEEGQKRCATNSRT